MSDDQQTMEFDKPQLPATVEAQPPALTDSPMAIIATAVQSGQLSVDVIERLAALQERFDDREAARQFNEAMTAFQAECPVIQKTSVAGDGKFQYKYAGYDNVMGTIRPSLSASGLSISFSSTQKDKCIAIECKISHKAGHSQTTTFECPIPGAMKVNDTQKMGAALSYAKRYALCAALNLIVSGEDMDGRGLSPVEEENPKANPNAPKTAPRGQRLTQDEVRLMLDIYLAQRPEIVELEPTEKTRELAGYVESVLGGPIDFNPANASGWNRADFNKVWKALKEVGSEST